MYGFSISRWLRPGLVLFSLVVVPVQAAASSTPGKAGPDEVVLQVLPSSSVYYIPQFVNGGVFPIYVASRISINSPVTTTNASVNITFYADNGTPWTVDLECVQDPNLSGSVSNRTLSLLPMRGITFTTTGTGALQTGWAKIESDCPLLVTASYTVYKATPVPTVIGSVQPNVLPPPPALMDVPVWEAAVLPAASGTRLSMNPVLGVDTVMANVGNEAGIAIANPSDSAADLTAQLISENGAVLAQKPLSLAAHGHVAMYASEMFSPFQPTGLLQSRIRLMSNVNITAMALQRQAGNGADLNGGVAVAADRIYTRTILPDTEFNGDHDHAQVIAAPAEIEGTVCDPKGQPDSDYYSIYLQAGQTVSATLLAESIGSQLYPVMWLENSTGAHAVDAASITAGARDIVLTFKASTTGTYFLMVSSVNGSWGAQSFYRVHVIVR